MAVSPTSVDVVVDRKVTVIGLGSAYKSIDEKVLEAGLRAMLLEALDRAEPPLIVLDLSQTTFFGSSFIEVLFRIWNRVKSRPGGDFVICGVTSYCQEVLNVAHLDTLWRIYPTREEAVDALLQTGD